MMQFKSVKYISTIDLRSGYWHVWLDERSREPCSFLFNGRNYSFKRMPIGPNVGGSEFQKYVDYVLGPAISDFVTIYVYGIIIIEKHCDHLRQVFERFRQHNVRINLGKSKFFQPEVKFLGHIISTEGIRMDSENIAAVMRVNVPKTRKDVQSYIGFLNFYRKYFKDFARLIQPLTELLTKENPLLWTEAHQDAFERSRKVFRAEIIVDYPDFARPCIGILLCQVSSLSSGSRDNCANGPSSLDIFTAKQIGQWTIDPMGTCSAGISARDLARLWQGEHRGGYPAEISAERNGQGPTQDNDCHDPGLRIHC